MTVSTDAGHFLCDYIYYTSLAELFKRHEERRVVFMHVPDSFSKQAVLDGRDVCMALIRSLVGSKANRQAL